MFSRTLIIGVFLIIPAGTYMYHFLKRILDFFGKKITSKRGKIILIVVTALFMFNAVNVFGIGAMVVLHIVMFALLTELVHFVVRHLQKKDSKAYRIWKGIYSVGIIPVILTAFIVSYGYINMNNVRKTEYVLTTEKNIRSDGYKIALITDVHYGNSVNQEELKRVCDEIENAKPDVVLLGGDIVDQNTTFEQMNEVITTFGSIESNYGVFFVYGNHDRGSFRSSSGYSLEQLNESLIKSGIHILADSIWDVNEELVLVGRRDAGWSNDSRRKSSEELIEDIDEDKFVLLIDHQPRELKQNSLLGYDLQLAGHTHGGQIWPVGLVSNIFGFDELVYGKKQINQYTAIVSSGLGGWGYPLRTGSHSEWVLINIQKSL